MSVALTYCSTSAGDSGAGCSEPSVSDAAIAPDRGASRSMARSSRASRARCRCPGCTRSEGGASRGRRRAPPVRRARRRRVHVLGVCRALVISGSLCRQGQVLRARCARWMMMAVSLAHGPTIARKHALASRAAFWYSQTTPTGTKSWSSSLDVVARAPSTREDEGARKHDDDVLDLRGPSEGCAVPGASRRTWSGRSWRRARKADGGAPVGAGRSFTTLLVHPLLVQQLNGSGRVVSAGRALTPPVRSR